MTRNVYGLMTRHGSSSNERSVLQQERKRAAPISECTFPTSRQPPGSCCSAHSLKARTAIAASSWCELPLASPTTIASHRKRPWSALLKSSQLRNAGGGIWILLRNCCRIQTVSVRPVARALAPAPADHGLPLSMGRCDVRWLGSSGIGTYRGHSKPRATRVLVLTSAAREPTSLEMSAPPLVVPPSSSRAQPKLPFLMEPMSAQ